MSICPQCQRSIPDDAPGGYCPVCVLGLAAVDPTEAVMNPAAINPAGIDDAIDRIAIPGVELISPIGQGGMGAVYRGRQRELDRIVAVKILPARLSRDPRFVERFRREARAMARLDHPHIIRVHDSGVTGGGVNGGGVTGGDNDGVGRCYIVMEFVEGTNLREAMAARAIDPASALRIVSQICDGLQYAHSMGVVHRDIKPENVLLGVDRRGVKIVDFGLAKCVDSAEADISLTATGARLGTVRYMAPEQYDGSVVDARADIYSLGVMFYEMLTGQVPMGAFSLPSQTAGTDPRLDDVIRRTLQQRPDDRYQSAGDVVAAISSISEATIDQTVDASGRSPQSTSAKIASSRSKKAKKKKAKEHFRYQSDARVFGLPVVCIAWGTDPETGDDEIATGVIAVGGNAIGGIAVGGSAIGVVAIGGAAIGVNAFGGAAIGLQTALGAASIGLGISGGAATIGLFAFGAAALGILVPAHSAQTGMTTLGRVMSDREPTSELEQSLQHFASLPETPWVLDLIFAQAFLSPLAAVLAVALYGWTRHVGRSANRPDDPEADSVTLSSAMRTRVTASVMGSVAAAIGLCVAAFVVAVTFNHAWLPS